MLVKPRFGRRRCNGIWPPSKPRIRRAPERERWPLWPRVDVLPMPEPMPRPTRFLFSLALRGARTFERFINPALVILETIASADVLLHNLQQVRHLLHHAADGCRVLALQYLVQARETQSPDHAPVFLRSTDGRAHPLDADFFFSRRCLLRLRYHHSSSTVLPRRRASLARSRRRPPPPDA